MRRIVAFALVLVLVVGVTAPSAHAGGGVATNVALGLASFAVFNQLFWPLAYARPVYAAPVYAVPAYPVYVERPVYYQHAYPTVINYPHGRYELRGDGVSTAYQWVWIPNPPPPPAAPPPPPTQ